MPSIRDSTDNVDTSQMEAVAFHNPPPQPVVDTQEPKNPFLRSPMPSIDSSPDSLRQFYGKGVPQFRVIPPPLPVTAGVKGDAGATGATGTNTTVTNSVQLKRQDIPLTATFNASLGPEITGTVHLGRTFELLKVKVGAASRLRLYSSAPSRDADKTRSTSTLPALYQDSGIIFDLNLDATYTYPYVWNCTPEAVGCDLSAFPAGDIAYTVDTHGALSVPSFSSSSTNVNVTSLAGIGNPLVLQAQFAGHAGVSGTLPYDVIVWFTSSASSGDYSTDLAGAIVLPFNDNGTTVMNVHASTSNIVDVFGAFTDWLTVPAGAVDWNWEVLTTPHTSTTAQYNYSNIVSYASIPYMLTILTEEK